MKMYKIKIMKVSSLKPWQFLFIDAFSKNVREKVKEMNDEEEVIDHTPRERCSQDWTEKERAR